MARILAKENAETLGSLEKEVSTLVCSVEIGFGAGSFSLLLEICTVFTAGMTATGSGSVAFVLSAIE